jgi:hypothetical protein
MILRTFGEVSNPETGVAKPAAVTVLLPVRD